MLNPVPPIPSHRLARRPPRSLKQEYEEFMLQRIEEYKDMISREALLEIGDEAVRELEENAAGQYLLTEVLLLEHVDRVIARRLRLPSFKGWNRKHRALRVAQREPTHWGLDHGSPIVGLARRLEPGDVVVVAGAAALAGALFLAAHDAEVFLLDQDLRAIEAAENRAVTEQLGGRFHALVIRLGSWLPDVMPNLVVIDPGALSLARVKDRQATILELQVRTRAGGTHLILPTPSSREVIPLAPDALKALYEQWQIMRGKRSRAGGGFIATKPERHLDTALNVSE